MNRTVLLGLAALLALGGCTVGSTDDSASGGAYPERGISILAPGSTGGGWDTRARGMENALTRCGVISEDVTVTNTPGAGGTIGLAEFNTKNGDPYQLMVMDTMTMLGGIVRNHSPIDLTTLTPIAGLTESVGAILVPANSKYTDFGSLLAAMKADPKGISWVGGSLGGPDQQQAIVDMVGKMRGTDCWKKTLRQNNWSDGWLPGDEFAKLIADHREKATTLLNELGLAS